MTKIQEIEDITRDMDSGKKEYQEFDVGNGTHTINVIIHTGKDSKNWITINIDGQDIETDKEVYDGTYILDENDDRYQDAHFNVVKVPAYIPEKVHVEDFPTDHRLYDHVLRDNMTEAIDPVKLIPNMFYIASQIWQDDFTNYDNEEFTDKEATMADFLINHWSGDHWDSSASENEYNQKYKPALDKLVQGAFDFYYEFNFNGLNNEMENGWNKNVEIKVIDFPEQAPIPEYLSSSFETPDPNIHFDEKYEDRTVIVVHYDIGNIHDVWIKTTMSDNPRYY